MSRGFHTLFYKEILRFQKVVLQTVVAPAITTLLYLLVFSHALEQHVTVFGDITYTAFLVPGLVMMTMIQNAFSNSSSSLIQSKITGNIVFVLLTPLSYVEFYLAFMLAAVARGLVVGLAVYLCAAPFVPLPLHSAVTVVAFALAGSARARHPGSDRGHLGREIRPAGGLPEFHHPPAVVSQRGVLFNRIPAGVLAAYFKIESVFST
jgi:ABC-type multidrug transport system permease subunit